MDKSRMAWAEIAPCCHDHTPSDHTQLRTHCCDFTVAQAELSAFERAAADSFPLTGWGVATHMAPGTAALIAPPLLLVRMHSVRPPPEPGSWRLAKLRVMRV